MGRPRVIKVGCLNISNARESAPTYLNLIEAAARLKKPIELSAHKFVIITSLAETQDNGVVGTFGRYTKRKVKSKSLITCDQTTLRFTSTLMHGNTNYFTKCGRRTGPFLRGKRKGFLMQF
jgi:hypothetical protein